MRKPLVLMSLFSTLFFNPYLSFAQEAAAKGDSEVGYIGTYTKKEGHVDGQAEGIYQVIRNTETGSLDLGPVAAEVINPSFVKLSPDGQYLYAVSELGPQDAESGYLHTFRINADQSLETVGKVSTIGYAPCHIAVDATGKYIFVSNYSGGVVVLFERGDNGSLKKRQVEFYEESEKSHPHSVTLSPDNCHAYIADLGYDRIRIYDFDPVKGLLTANEQPFVGLEKGSGPRHLAFSKKGKFAYSINELNNSISAFKVKEGGGLEFIESISSLPGNFSGKSHGADIHLRPSGKFLYVSNRGHNSIAGYDIDDKTGRLKNIGFTDTQGDFPRNFAISEDGRFLYVANQNTNNLSTYSIADDGSLESLSVPMEIKSPVCIEFQ